jgi:hypothetical protein
MASITNDYTVELHTLSIQLESSEFWQSNGSIRKYAFMRVAVGPNRYRFGEGGVVNWKGGEIKMGDLWGLNVIRPNIGDKDKQTWTRHSRVAKTRVMTIFARRHCQITTMKLGMGQNKQETSAGRKDPSGGRARF